MHVQVESSPTQNSLVGLESQSNGYYKVKVNAFSAELEIDSTKVWAHGNAYHTFDEILKNIEQLHLGDVERRDTKTIAYVEDIYRRYIEKYEHTCSFSKVWYQFLNLFRYYPMDPRRVGLVKGLYQTILNAYRSIDDDQESVLIRAISLRSPEGDSYNENRIKDLISTICIGLDKHEHELMSVALNDLIQKKFLSLYHIRIKDADFQLLEKSEAMFREITKPELRAKMAFAVLFRVGESYDSQDLQELPPIVLGIDPNGPGMAEFFSNYSDLQMGMPVRASKAFSQFSVAERKDVFLIAMRNGLFDSSVTELREMLKSLPPEVRASIIKELKNRQFNDNEIKGVFKLIQLFSKKDYLEAFQVILSQFKTVDSNDSFGHVLEDPQHGSALADNIATINKLLEVLQLLPKSQRMNVLRAVPGTEISLWQLCKSIVTSGKSAAWDQLISDIKSHPEALRLSTLQSHINSVK